MLSADSQRPVAETAISLGRGNRSWESSAPARLTAEVQAEQQGGQGEQQGYSVESGQSSAEEWFEQQLLEGERLQGTTHDCFRRDPPCATAAVLLL
ncbi:hypothetical protein [Synechococcus sp. MIT S9509]|uniref:hypothetical protein n=1 Tax=Synechococcus sp. MIT S9509 TaxID=1801630 RepID=UPI00082B9DAE